MIEFTDEEIKEDLWAWNDFQDRIWAEERASQDSNTEQAGDRLITKLETKGDIK